MEKDLISKTYDRISLNPHLHSSRPRDPQLREPYLMEPQPIEQGSPMNRPPGG